MLVLQYKKIIVLASLFSAIQFVHASLQRTGCFGGDLFWFADTSQALNCRGHAFSVTKSVERCGKKCWAFMPSRCLTISVLAFLSSPAFLFLSPSFLHNPSPRMPMASRHAFLDFRDFPYFCCPSHCFASYPVRLYMCARPS